MPSYALAALIENESLRLSNKLLKPLPRRSRKAEGNLRSEAGGNTLKREPRRPIWRTMSVGARDLLQRGA